MTDHAGHIRNPLTVISIFAGIAEISGTIVLPFIAPENQGTYIWLLMLFPVLLVVAFFLTLNLNHKTLYAPSDYENQNHFLSLFGIVTSDEKETKLIEEVFETTASVNEAQDTGAVKPPSSDGVNHSASAIHLPQKQAVTLQPADEDPSQQNGTADNSAIIKESVEEESPTENSFNLLEFAKKSEIDFKNRLKKIELKSIQRLREATNVSFSENVKFDIPNLHQPLIFDAVAHHNETIHIAEVKYFDKSGFTADRFTSTLNNANVAAHSVYKLSNRKVVLHLIVVLATEQSPGRYHNIKIALLNIAKVYPFETKVYIITEHALFNRGLPSSWLEN